MKEIERLQAKDIGQCLHKAVERVPTINLKKKEHIFSFDFKIPHIEHHNYKNFNVTCLLLVNIRHYVECRKVSILYAFIAVLCDVQI